MPVDYKNYPPNWKTEIRPRILERDGHCCKQCGIKNFAIRDKRTGEPYHLTGTTHKASVELALMLYGEEHPRQFSIVVLTIAHIENPNPMDCRDENLAALCQKCHNKLDATMRRVNAKATIEAKKQAATGQMSIF